MKSYTPPPVSWIDKFSQVYVSNKSNILITGGTGMVGSAIKSISESYSEYKFIYISSKDYDLTNFESTEKMFIDYAPEYVIHLAACVGGLYKNMNQKIDMFEKNLQINYNVVKCSYLYKVKKMIACLSTCIFPDKTSYPIDENMLHNGPPHDSNDAYAYAKRMLEIQCRMYRENHGCNFVCIIPTNIYGKYDNYSLEDGHVLPALIHKCFLAKQNNEDFIIRGSGKPLRQFIYSEDLAKLMMNILFIDPKIDSIDNIILSVPEKDEVSIETVAIIIAKYFDYEDRIVFDNKYSDGQYKKTASNEKMMELFPNFKFTEVNNGIQKTIEWFVANFEKVRI
jgi:GDP-L-fucose synthase